MGLSSNRREPTNITTMASHNFKIDEPNNQNHSNQVTIPVPPYRVIHRICFKPLQTMASNAKSPLAHLVQDTAGMANRTPPTPFPSGIQVTLPNSQFFCPQDHCKMEKTTPSMQTTYQFILINIVITEEITVPLPSTDNDKRFLAISLLPSFQFSRELLKNSPRYIQSSSSPPPHHPKFTSIIHRRFGSDYGASTIHRQHQTIPTTRLLPSLQFLRKSLENSQRHIQSSSSPPTSNQVQGPTYTFQNHTTIFLEDQSLTNCHNTTSSHNAPSLTTLSSCPNPPMTTTHRIFSKEGRDTKLGSPMHPKPD